MKGRLKVRTGEGDIEKKEVGDAVDQQKREHIIEEYSIMLECLHFTWRKIY